jgi:hypothetical protein
MGCSGAFDLEGSDADSITFVQDVVGGNGLAIDTDQIVLGLASGNALLEEFRNGGLEPDFDVIGKAAAEVVDQEDPHDDSPCEWA